MYLHMYGPSLDHMRYYLKRQKPKQQGQDLECAMGRAREEGHVERDNQAQRDNCHMFSLTLALTPNLKTEYTSWSKYRNQGSKKGPLLGWRGTVECGTTMHVWSVEERDSKEGGEDTEGRKGGRG